MSDGTKKDDNMTNNGQEVDDPEFIDLNSPDVVEVEINEADDLEPMEDDDDQDETNILGDDEPNVPDQSSFSIDCHKVIDFEYGCYFLC